MTRLAILTLVIIALCAVAALADTISVSGSLVTLQETVEPEAIAEILFDNRNVNGPHNTGNYELLLGNLSVGFKFEWTSGDDSIAVYPPSGVSCVPETCILRLREDTAGTLWLFGGIGSGM